MLMSLRIANLHNIVLWRSQRVQARLKVKVTSTKRRLREATLH